MRAAARPARRRRQPCRWSWWASSCSSWWPWASRWSALSSDSVHDALKKFFGLYADEPSCSGDEPGWVKGLSISDERLGGLRARFHACGETAGRNLRVRVANNRNYGVELQTARTSRRVSMLGGENPRGLLDIAVKEAAEELIGGSYLWALSTSSFQLPFQRAEWQTTLRTTGATLFVDGIRIALDLLKIAVPAVEFANLDVAPCIESLSDHANPEAVDLGSPGDWSATLGLVVNCINPNDIKGGSKAAKALREGLGQVKKALKWTSTAASAAKWGLTAADLIKDTRRQLPPATITVQSHQQSAPSDQFTAVSAGSRHSCGLRAGGAVECWGDNDHGQSDFPYGKFTAVSAGYSHSCGVRAGETVECWGPNWHGQTDAPSDQFTAVSAGDLHSCGLRVGGAAECWGNNRHGQLDAPSGRFTAVSAGGNHSCGLRADGALQCWGRKEYGQSHMWSGEFTAVSAGWHHSCGLRADGAVKCRGLNVEGEADAPSGEFTVVSAGDLAFVRAACRRRRRMLGKQLGRAVGRAVGEVYGRLRRGVAFVRAARRRRRRMLGTQRLRADGRAARTPAPARARNDHRPRTPRHDTRRSTTPRHNLRRPN